MSSTRELLARNRDFRRLFLASVVSLGGDWFSFVAVADLVLELTGRPGTAAYVYAATVLPVFLASPIVGKLADRYDRRKILMFADLFRVPVALSLCIAAYYGSVPVAVIAIVMLGVGASFYDPTAVAATPNLVDDKDLATAQSLMGAVWGTMLLVGAGLGGLVAETLGRYAAFAIDAASFLVSAWLVSGIRRPMQQPRVAGEDHGRLRDVIAYARKDKIVGRLLLAKGGVSWSNGIVGLLPAFAHGKFAGVPVATGMLFAARGLGALLGPLIARRISGATPSPRAIVALCAASTLCYGAFYAVFPFVPWFGVALVLVMLAHLGGGAQWALSTFGLQVATPDHLRGRVMSLDYGLATLAIGVSALVAGAIADGANEELSTWVLAVVAGVYGTVWWLWSRVICREPATR
ncbi:MAG: MFS transporter [Deltaproteobacteria bacterium]|nr:MFS transporter [Deltaproteobacteria bacterium]